MAEQVVNEMKAGPASEDSATNSDGHPALAVDLQCLSDYLERGDVDGAREFVEELEQRWPDSDRVRYFARVLAPPVVRSVPGAPNMSFHREHAWLREHARKYPGCWLAVYQDQLVVADPDLGVVLDTVREKLGEELALIHRQHGEPTCR